MFERAHRIKRQNCGCTLRLPTTTKQTQMPRQTIPMGTFTSTATAPVASTSLLTPSGALTVPSGRRGVLWGVGGLECPRLYPHLSHPNPSSPLRSLFMPLPSPFQAPPWGRWQPSTVKGWGSHDGFHRWSVEIAGKDLNSVEQQRARESEGEIWVEKTEREREMGDKERVRERVRRRESDWERRGRRRWCLFKEVRKSVCYAAVKNAQVWCFLSTFFHLSLHGAAIVLLHWPTQLSRWILRSTDTTIQRIEMKRASFGPLCRIVSRLDSRDLRGATLSLLLKSSWNPGSAHNR